MWELCQSMEASLINTSTYLTENFLRKWHGYWGFIMLLAGLEEERGEKKKKLKKGALHLNDGLVHRPVSPVWQETLSSWSAVTLVCRGQVRECVNTQITEPGNGFFAPLCSRNMSSVCGENCYVWLNASLMGFALSWFPSTPILLHSGNIYT